MSTPTGVPAVAVRRSLGQLLRFGLVGVLSNVVYFAVLPVLSLWLGLPLWLAGGASYACSVVVNYLLQRSVTFASKRSHLEGGPRYLLVQAVALGLNSGLLELLVTRLGWPFLIGQGIALVVTMTWNYLCQKLWVFAAPR